MGHRLVRYIYIRRKTPDIVLELVLSENVDEDVTLLKKRVKTQSGEHEKNGDYRQMLVHAIYSCTIKFSRWREFWCIC